MPKQIRLREVIEIPWQNLWARKIKKKKRIRGNYLPFPAAYSRRMTRQFNSCWTSATIRWATAQIQIGSFWLFFQCIIASPSVSVCTSELRLIQHSLIRPGNVIATQHSLYAALHRVGDAIIITDDALRIQHANKMTERLLGWKVVS